MSLTPAQDQVEAQRKKDAIELCGKNRGPHDYIPIEWRANDVNGITNNRVIRMLCRVCFCNVTVRTFLENYPEVSYEKTLSNSQ